MLLRLRSFSESTIRYLRQVSNQQLYYGAILLFFDSTNAFIYSKKQNNTYFLLLDTIWTKSLTSSQIIWKQVTLLTHLLCKWALCTVANKFCLIIFQWFRVAPCQLLKTAARVHLLTPPVLSSSSIAILVMLWLERIGVGAMHLPNGIGPFGETLNAYVSFHIFFKNLLINPIGIVKHKVSQRLYWQKVLG